jgi:hypothetical protein
VDGAALRLGTADNTFGAVAPVSPKDVWAVGNFLPDTPSSNLDATLSMAAHFDGTRWTSTPTPDTGPNFNTLFGVAAVPGRAWAVGVALDRLYQAHSLVEAWDGTAWHVVATPALDTQRDYLTSATAVSANDVWAVGERQDHAGLFSTLVEHFDGHRWSVVPSPNPGAAGNHLYGVAAASSGDVWAVGSGPTGRWSSTGMGVVPGVGVLDAVAVQGNDVWAVGQTDDAAHQAHPLVLRRVGADWTAAVPAGIGAPFFQRYRRGRGWWCHLAGRHVFQRCDRLAAHAHRSKRRHRLAGRGSARSRHGRQSSRRDRGDRRGIVGRWL